MPTITASTDATVNRARLAALIWVTAAALLFSLLLLMVRLHWSPLESLDRGLADRLNLLVADDSVLVAVLKRVT